MSDAMKVMSYELSLGYDHKKLRGGSQKTWVLLWYNDKYIYIQYMFYAVLHLLKDFYRSNNGKFSEMTLLVSNVEPTEEATHCA